jgi:hydrogenase maturation protease
MIEAALVIGYGNALCGDDGAGPGVARLLSAVDGADVSACGQLTPELADDLRDRAVVVFVDASATLDPGAVAVRPLAASGPSEPGLTHHFSPEALLLLAERLYGAQPRAFLVTVGAASFALGEDLSPRVAAALPEAAAVVRRLLAAPDEVRCGPCPEADRRRR